MVTMGQVGQLIFLQDSLYFVTAPASTIHSQCVHTSTISLSPALTNTHEVKHWKHYSNFLSWRECCFSAWLTPITVWLRTQASKAAAGRKAQIIILLAIIKQCLMRWTWGQIRTNGTRITLVWKSHLLVRQCNCSLPYNQCIYSMMRLRESLHFLPNCRWVYHSGSGGSNPACHSVIRFPAGRMECPQWSSWRLLQRWTLRPSLSHTAATHIYHVETAIPLPPIKRQTLKSNGGEEKQLNRTYKQKYIVWADGLLINERLEILHILLWWENTYTSSPFMY